MSLTPEQKRARGFAACSPEQCAEYQKKGIEGRKHALMAWNWSRELPRLRANVRAAVLREIAEAAE